MKHLYVNLKIRSGRQGRHPSGLTGVNGSPLHAAGLCYVQVFRGNLNFSCSVVDVGHYICRRHIRVKGKLIECLFIFTPFCRRVHVLP